MCKKAPENVNYDGVKFTDLDTKIVSLASGEYLVDGNLVVVSYGKQDVAVVDDKNIRKITNNRIIERYNNGESDISVEDYNLKREILLSKLVDDEWETLDDEFAYRKFMSSWQAIYKEVQELGDPLIVKYINAKYDTGNKFISNAYLSGIDRKEKSLYTYNQSSAWIEIVNECFTELKMENKGDCRYNSTSNKKIWGNSNHSCIRYVVAFGSYVFNDAFSSPRMITGKLKDMQEHYELDRKNIRSIILKQYYAHFGSIDSGRFDFKSLLSAIRKSKSYLSDVEPKQKSYESWNKCSRVLDSCINMIESSYEVNE